MPITAKDVFPELLKGGMVNRSPAAAARDRAVRECYRRMQRQGWEDVTIVNLHPFQLNLHMGPLGHLTVPAKKTGEMYSMLVLKQPRISMEDNGDDKFIPIPVFPKEMADDLIRYYKDQGGVFYFDGEGRPPEGLYEAALEKQHEWYHALLQEAAANWQQYTKNPKYISDRMRDAAKELYRLKLIDKLPEWVVITKADSPDFPCEICGQIIPKVAAYCAHCETIYNVDVVKARRPDIWAKQNPAEAAMKSGAGTGMAPNIEELIVNEEASSKKKNK